MSKLKEKLEKLEKAAGAPIGFGAPAQKEATPTLLLLALLTKKDAQLARRAAEAGADLLVTTGQEPVKADVSMGIQVEEVTEDGLKRFRTAGYDFMLFSPAKTTSAIFAEQDLGKVIMLDEDVPESHLRAIDDLPVDAVLYRSTPEALTVGRLMTYRRVSQLVSRPLLVCVSSSKTPSTAELEAVRDVGVKGLVVEVSDATHVDGLAALRQRINALSSRRRKPERGRVTAVLPSLTTKQEEPAPRREDDDDGDQ